MPDWGKTYTAQVVGVMTRDGYTRHLRIWRHDRKDTLIPWSVLQRIKNDMLGPDVTAVEIFPAVSDVVDEVNIRHLWEVSPDDILPNLRQ